MRTFATVGVYGFTAETFLAVLRRQGVDVVLDVRQRRGVRGAQYAWANVTRLRRALADAGIEYDHRPDLAPTTELRQLQYREDDRQGVGKRSRMELAAEYRKRYVAEILDHVDLATLLGTLPDPCVAALLCVETQPQACHRSLIAERLRAAGATVVDLRP